MPKFRVCILTNPVLCVLTSTERPHGVLLLKRSLLATNVINFPAELQTLYGLQKRRGVRSKNNFSKLVGFCMIRSLDKRVTWKIILLTYTYTRCPLILQNRAKFHYAVNLQSLSLPLSSRLQCTRIRHYPLQVM
ncbi:uncharacterized protein BJ212DRAFT_193972 [Suillus subaureus]|uniref:Uncharacterized protein n=1 Tax=Suillus subaureus TaxID=48587 RepID=A0A9P7EAZ9_9AGAM|nr:uncharacterized protein BJ212DRAFT_193972 [Suillus subaureus]KAG1816516.1 hypothetical protein BJ212DRAFT_193972 [Suillus subaureus]